MYQTYNVRMVVEGFQEGMDRNDLDMALYKLLRHSSITVTVEEILEDED